jgi:heptosyltransferase III
MDGNDGDVVALVRGGALGDFVLTLPVIRALRNAFPESRLLLIGHPATARLAGEAKRIDADSAEWARMYTPAGPSAGLAASLANCRLLVACLPGGRQAAPTNYRRNLHGLCKDLLFGDPRPEPGQTRHMVERLLDPIRDAGMTLPDSSTPCIDLPTRTPKQDLLILHPGSGGRGKCWPAKRFAELLTHLQKQGHKVAILWGPAENSRQQEFPSALRAPTTLLSPASPWELANCLASARLYIGNDTGPGHVAAAVGCPTISIFGSTDAKLWRPLGPGARVIQAPGGDLQSLSLGIVVDAIDAELAANGSSPPPRRSRS